MQSDYPPISSYAIIGNGRTAALVGRDGSIDWCCWPRFDSPAVFCRTVDVNRGGFFRIAPTENYQVRREYAGPTNVLQTTFETEEGTVRLTDLMPAPRAQGEAPSFPHRIIRCVEGIDGVVPLEMVFRPTFDYASTPARISLHPEGAIAIGNGESLALAVDAELEVRDDAVVGRISVQPGQTLYLSLTHGPPEESHSNLRFSDEEAARELDRTIRYWSEWAERCGYHGPHRLLVQRSALVLKLLVYEPSGGLVAAPTTGFPVGPGGVRNWDYRYTWLRDAGLVLDALQTLGYHEESKAFIDWLQRLWRPGQELDLAPLYRVDGEPAPDEQELEYLEGYRGSRPVHIGNQAVNQRQTDLYGHVIDAVTLCYERMPREMDDDLWKFLCALADRAAVQWKEQDRGPWEIQGPPKNYVFSKLYCWVGLDRISRFAERRGLPGDVARWKSQRDAIREEILARGYRPERGAFTMAYESEDLDASLLTMTLAEFLPPDDERIVSTVQAIQNELAQDGLVYRYRIEDAMPGSDATFTLCSFWLAMNLAMAGRISEAKAVFEHICSFANDVGLLSEEIDPETGESRGNFPQGFSHLGLIQAAIFLQEAEKNWEGR